MVELLAAMVLFAGGVEVPFRNFKKFFLPIASLSLVGTVMTALLFSLALEQLAGWLGVAIPLGALLLTGTILASTDPTAIIPSLETLRFKRSFLRDLAISESAVNDVVGTILTRSFLVMGLTAMTGTSVISLFIPFFSRHTLDTLALEIIWGIGVGILGAWILRSWSADVEKGRHRAIDPALFFAVPIFTFALGSLVGGSGFLAAFVAGLLFDATSGTHQVRRFFEIFVDRFIKPIIFLLLGGVVPIAALISTAILGIVSALNFMFIIRPFIVLVSLSPWFIKKRALFSGKELLFISFIRETGVIPAVLILVAAGSGVAGSEYIFAIGMWVILLTLLLEPPLTPWLAKKLGVAIPHA